MKRRKSDFLRKKSHKVLIGLIAALIVSSVLVCCFAGCSSQSNVETTAPYEVDEETYVFGAGYSIGAINLDGMLYKDAKALAQDECLAMIKDFLLTVKAEDETFDFNKEAFEWDTNVDTSLQAAAKHYDLVKAGKEEEKAMHFDLTFKVNGDSVDTAIAAVAKEVDVEPVDANIEVSGEDITFVNEKTGYMINREKLKEDMLAEIEKLSKGEKKDATVTAEMKEVAPKVTSDELDKDVKLLGTATSYSTNTADGDHNMSLALQACNGSVIKPGEVWSFNECTGNSNLTSNGYREATVIVGGKYEQGVGGGICQASTVIYQAALKSNVGIYERHAHAYKSSYAEVGLDATIDYPGLDLRLQNNTDYPLYLQCYMDENANLYASFYGWQDPSYDKIELKSWKYNEDYEANSYYAAAQRLLYKNGKLVYTEDLPVSHYSYYVPEETKPTTSEKPKPTKPATTNPTPTKPAPTQAPEPVETTAAVVVPPETAATTAAATPPSTQSRAAQN